MPAPAARLVVLTGDTKGKVIALDGPGPYLIGRYRKSDLRLSDDNCSRKHAEIVKQDDRWVLRDLGSRNGTLIGGVPVKSFPLSEGDEIQIGGTLILFSLASSETSQSLENPLVALDGMDTTSALLARDPLPHDDLTSLCRFMADAVNDADWRQLVRRALDTARNQTNATLAGYLGLDEEGELQQRLVLPEASKVDYHLSRSLTRQAEQQKRVIWLAEGGEERSCESILAFEDALCAPLLVRDQVLGTLHVYRAAGVFVSRDVRFCEILARHLAGSMWMLRARRSLQAENLRLRQHSPVADGIVGRSDSTQALRDKIRKVAPHSSTVLIRGESGVGKELVAQALHQLSPRKDGPFVVINCAAIPESLMESQLFGHKKGAFTNADADHVGFFQQADSGTLFLDEIGELPTACQAKLLRVLEGKGFVPLGSAQEIVVDVRFLAATNRNLEEAVRDKRFREDLYFRLKVIQIEVPPLRDHAEDIPLLAEYYLAQMAARLGRQVRLSPAAKERLKGYPWPGNVRQLICALESAAILAEREVIEADELASGETAVTGGPPSLELKVVTRWAYQEALKRANGSITDAAAMLGVARDTFYRNARQFELIPSR